jgi:hypothetical protein
MRRTLKTLFINDIEDYFRRLGGQGCYLGYQDWHSPALIICLLLNINIAFNIHPSMVNETNQLPVRIKEDLNQILIDKNQIDEFMLFVKKILEKTRSNDLVKFENFIDENKVAFDNFVNNQMRN